MCTSRWLHHSDSSPHTIAYPGEKPTVWFLELRNSNLAMVLTDIYVLLCDLV